LTPSRWAGTATRAGGRRTGRHTATRLSIRRANLRHHWNVTNDTTPQTPLPPDPERYDEYRNVAARKRGLKQPYIAGGDDPNLPQQLERERPYVLLLALMVAAIVALGFVLGIVSAIITGA
jgi:hypothetical protein